MVTSTNCDRCSAIIEQDSIRFEDGRLYTWKKYINRLHLSSTFHGSSTTFTEFFLDRDLCKECFKQIQDIVVDWHNKRTSKSNLIIKKVK